MAFLGAVFHAATQVAKARSPRTKDAGWERRDVGRQAMRDDSAPRSRNDRPPAKNLPQMGGQHYGYGSLVGQNGGIGTLFNARIRRPHAQKIWRAGRTWEPAATFLLNMTHDSVII